MANGHRPCSTEVLRLEPGSQLDSASFSPSNWVGSGRKTRFGLLHKLKQSDGSEYAHKVSSKAELKKDHHAGMLRTVNQLNQSLAML